jgi:hypothetical protein
MPVEELMYLLWVQMQKRQSIGVSEILEETPEIKLKEMK